MQQEQAFSQLKNIFESGNLAGSWLIYGPKGVGKKELIQKFCGFLLTGTETPLSFHSDLKWIEKDYTEAEKKEIIKILDSGNTLDINEKRAKKTEITIDDIRKGIQFLSLTSATNKWRILVIDTGDDMNLNAANALLKILEEPPQKTVIFILSNNIGKLLSTIKSRCRTIHLNPLAPQYTGDKKDKVIDELYEGCNYKKTTLIKNEAEEIYHKMENLLHPPMDISAIFSFADNIVKDFEKFSIIHECLALFLLKKAKSEFSSKRALDPIFDLWDEIEQTFRELDSLSLDKKGTLISVLIKIGNLS